MTLRVGAETREAAYVSGDDTAALVFAYAVDGPDWDDDGFEAEGLDGGSIADGDGNPAAGKPFAQLQAAGMQTAVMDEIMRQRDPALKAAVEASLAGDIARAFEKLGENVAEVNADNLAGAAAARWLALSPEERERTGLMAPSHALRERINEIIRERLARDGVMHGPSMQTERLASVAGRCRVEESAGRATPRRRRKS